jgi:hypothetical protein
MNRLVRPTVGVLAAAVLSVPVGVVSAVSRTGIANGQPPLSGVVHETQPTDDRKLADVRVQIAGASSGPAVTSDADGRFAIAAVPGAVVEFSKAGYEPARITIRDAGAPLDVAMMPAAREISIARSGANDCTDLPAPPAGVPGVREYARFAVHHDGSVLVTAAKLPFASNPGFLYRQTASGWVRNEIDYVLLRQPLPVLGGFWYVLTFGEGMDNCGSWSIDATHPG